MGCTKRGRLHGSDVGAVNFETTETQIVCDENGRIEKIVPRVRNVAHRLIREAMLAANVCSADFLLREQARGAVPGARGPTPEKGNSPRLPEGNGGIPSSVSDDPSPGEFPAIARGHQDRPDAQQSTPMLLRSMHSKPSIHPLTVGILAGV